MELFGLPLSIETFNDMAAGRRRQIIQEGGPVLLFLNDQGIDIRLARYFEHHDGIDFIDGLLWQRNQDPSITIPFQVKQSFFFR